MTASCGQAKAAAKNKAPLMLMYAGLDKCIDDGWPGGLHNAAKLAWGRTVEFSR